MSKFSQGSSSAASTSSRFRPRAEYEAANFSDDGSSVTKNNKYNFQAPTSYGRRYRGDEESTERSNDFQDRAQAFLDRKKSEQMQKMQQRSLSNLLGPMPGSDKPKVNRKPRQHVTEAANKAYFERRNKELANSKPDFGG